PHEMADLSEHTGELRALLALDGTADLAQPERPQRAAVLLRLADHGTGLRDLQRLAHAVSVSSGAAVTGGASAAAAGIVCSSGTEAVCSSAAAGGCSSAASVTL